MNKSKLILTAAAIATLCATGAYADQTQCVSGEKSVSFASLTSQPLTLCGNANRADLKITNIPSNISQETLKLSVKAADSKKSLTNNLMTWISPGVNVTKFNGNKPSVASPTSIDTPLTELVKASPFSIIFDTGTKSPDPSGYSLAFENEDTNPITISINQK